MRVQQFCVVLVIVLAALIAPGVSLGGAHWSAPSDVGFSIVHPTVWLGADGRSRVVAGDGASTWLASGDVANRFSVPADLFPGVGPPWSVTAAARPNGSALLTWSDRGCVQFVHLLCGRASALSALVLAADGTRSARQPLAPGEALIGGGSASSVVDGLGRSTVAWREQARNGSSYAYRVQAVQVSAGGAFGDPVELVNGSESVADVEAGAGLDGTVAVAWTQSARVRVSVRPAGAAAFGPPETIAGDDAPGTRNMGLQVAVGDDGTVSIGWVNGGGAFVRERPPGGAFATATTLTTDPWPALRLTRAPADGLAAAWALPVDATNPTPLRFALRPRGGAYTVEDIGPAFGSPDLAFDAGGTAYLVWERRGIPGVMVSVRSPSGTWAEPVLLSTERYVTPIVAAGPAGRAVAAWLESRDISPVLGQETAPEVVVASTFGPSPEGGTPGAPGSGPATGKDTRAPHPMLWTKGLRLRSTITVPLVCSESCAATANAVLAAGARRFPLRPVAARTFKRAHYLRFSIPTSTLLACRRALAARRTVRLRIKLRVTDRAGNAGGLTVAAQLAR